MRSHHPRSGLQNVTAAGAVAGLAFVAQQALPLVNVSMRTVFALIAAAFVGVLGLLVTRTGTLRAEADARDAREREVDALLACWPPPRIASTNAYDLGALPSAVGRPDPPPYVPRAVDAQLEERIGEPGSGDVAARPGGVTLVVGATGAGKTRTAFEALRRRLPEARVLVPENRESLNRLLALPVSRFTERDNGRGRARDEDWVLWLDDVDRYLDALELDGLDRLRQQGVRVVGTLRLERLEELVASSSEQGRLARRLLARASVVTLPDALDAEERALAADAYADRDFSNGFAHAFRPEWCATDTPLYSPAVGEPRAPTPLRNDPTIVGAFALVCLLFAALLFLGATNRAVKPPPLTEQMADRRRAIVEGCGTTNVQPQVRNDAEDRAVFFVLARTARACQESDAVHVFEVRDGRLREAGAFQPRPSRNDYYRLECRGDDAAVPCLVRGASDEPAFVAAWYDPAARAMAPFVVRRDRDRFELSTLETERPVVPADINLTGEPPPVRAQYGRKLSIPAVAGDAMDGYVVHDFALVQKRGDPMLVRAFVWRGTSYAPEQLEIVAARLELQSVPALERCVHPVDLTESGMVVRVPPRGAIPALLHRRWNAVLDATGRC